MDVGLSKYRKLIGTLPQHCDKTGLDLQQVDLTLMLLRSLPSDVKNYVVLHAAPYVAVTLRRVRRSLPLGVDIGPYQAGQHVSLLYIHKIQEIWDNDRHAFGRRAGWRRLHWLSHSLKYEQQQHLFQEIGAHVHALEGDASWEGYYDYYEEQDYPAESTGNHKFSCEIWVPLNQAIEWSFPKNDPCNERITPSRQGFHWPSSTAGKATGRNLPGRRGTGSSMDTRSGPPR